MLLAAADTQLDILEEHIDELEALWERRPAALTSPDHHPRSVQAIDGRIEAHADALVVEGEEAVGLLIPALAAAETAARATAAAYALMKMEGALGEETRRRVLETLIDGGAPVVRAGAGAALCHAPLAGLEAPLTELLRSADLAVAPYAAQALAIHERAPDLRHLPPPSSLGEPAARAACWNAWAAAATGARAAPAADELARGLGDPDPAVQEAAVRAAALFREPALRELLRAQVAHDDAAALERLAVLAEDRDVPALVAALARAELGPGRYLAVAPAGHSALLAPLLDAAASASGAESIAAALAFHRLTGLEAWTSDRRITLPHDWLENPPGDAEVTEEFPLADAARLRAAWQQQQGRFSGGRRWYLGRDLAAAPLDAATLAAVDMRTHTQLFLRAAHRGEDLSAFLPFWRRLHPLI